MWANYVHNFGFMTIWGIALVTQILSFAGLFADINMLVWGYGVVIGGIYMTIAYDFMLLLASFTAYGEKATADGFVT